jgi:hypothetical protein
LNFGIGAGLSDFNTYDEKDKGYLLKQLSELENDT